jgi:KDO2-lipid IV(A) lauroyltransferase
VASRALRAYRLGSTVVRALPRPVAHAIGRLAGAAAVPLVGDRRAQVERNLRRVHGPGFGGFALRRAVAATFESYARYYVDSFRLPGTSPEALEAGIIVDGWEKIDAALDNHEGTGVILALPHLGGWEWAGFWVAACRRRPGRER